MASTRAKNLVTVGLLESNPAEARFAEILRDEKLSSGMDIKPQVFGMIKSYLDPVAVGQNPDSTKADIEEALIRSLNTLASQMSWLATYCRTKHGIELTSESWQRFGLLFSPIAQVGTSSDVRQNLPSVPESQSESWGQRLSRENHEGLIETLQEIPSPQTLAAPEVLMEPVITPAPAPAPVPEVEEDDYDPDYDPEDDLSDEEYSALVLGRIPDLQEVVHYD